MSDTACCLIEILIFCHEFYRNIQDASYRKTLQSAATPAAWENYREKRNIARRISRRKKRKLEKQERVELEKLRESNEVRKFYQKVKHLTQSFKPDPSACKDKNGYIALDTQCALKLWR